MQAYHETEQTLDARTFLSILDGDYESVFLTSCVIEGAVIFPAESAVKSDGLPVVNKEIVCIGCRFKNVVKFEKIHFQKEICFAEVALFKRLFIFVVQFFKIHAILESRSLRVRHSSKEHPFTGKTNFRQTCFQQAADFQKVEFQENTIFRNAVFQDAVHFSWASFNKALDCVHAHFSETTVFNHSKFLGKIDFTSARFAISASYQDVRYPTDTIWQWLKNKWKQEPDQPTEFYLDSEDINEVLNPFFKRYVADQQFIRAFKERNPFWAQIWRWSSDYGRSLVLWALWSLLIAFSFSLLYMMPGPSWFPEWLQERMPQFHQATGTDMGAPLTFWKSFYFSIVTFTTLGFGDVVADNTLARILVTLEVIFGYIMLGGLISIFANKLASRS